MVEDVVTVVFSDLAGSTSLGERLDPESLGRVMARWFEAMRAVLERHGGTVQKFIGDAVMAVFGIPALHEDDAVRAVRAAAELRRGAGEQAERLAREAVDLAARTDHLEEHADALMTLAEVLRRAGRAAEATPALGEALRLYEQKGNTVLAGRAREALARPS